MRKISDICNPRMPVQPNQDWLSCQICFNNYTDQKHLPLSLSCGHVVCKLCMVTLDTGKCPLDQTLLPVSIQHLPINNALLLVMGYDPVTAGEMNFEWRSVIGSENMVHYENIMAYMEMMGEYLMGWIKGELCDDYSLDNSPLTKPMQRKLLTLLSCQVAEPEGRTRAARCARSIGERIVSELILHHQQHQQLSAFLWAAVRARGCQFLGPAMQEEVLILILKALKSGESMSRKVLVLHVVQHLEKQFPHASKTAIGHVVQLLYRASCFKVKKRDDQSSLMELKEEFFTYENLRREHDSQIVQIASEAGLRIAPEQWSSLLYGDSVHKSHMQSIIDTLQSPQSFSQSVNELLIALQRSCDPCNLSDLRPHLDLLASIEAGNDCTTPSWEKLASVLQAICYSVQKYLHFVLANQRKPSDLTTANQTKFKTSMCRDFSQRGSCPRGNSCTFAHSIEEMERFRARCRRGRAQGQGQGQCQVRFGQGALDLTPEIVTGSHFIPPNISGTVAPPSVMSVGTTRAAVSTSSIATVTSLVSSLGGTIATSSILPPSSALSQNRQTTRCAGSSQGVLASLTGKTTYTTSQSRYGQHRNQQTVVRVGSSYQESQYSNEHLETSDRYQPSLPAQVCPQSQQHDHTDLQEVARQCKVQQSQMGSQPLVHPQQNLPAGLKSSESLPLLQLRNQSLLNNLYRRRDELLLNLGPSVPTSSSLIRTTLQNDHVCCGGYVSGVRCCAPIPVSRDAQYLLPSNVMTPGLSDRLMNRSRGFTQEELSRSVSDSAASIQATARVDHVVDKSAAPPPTLDGPSTPHRYGAPLTDVETTDSSWSPFVSAATIADSDSDYEEGNNSDSPQENSNAVWRADNSAKESTAAGTSSWDDDKPTTVFSAEEPDVLWLACGDDEEIPFVPFDPPFVSKYGPISRAARMKVTKNTAPKVMDALRNSGPTPVTLVTPTSRPQPSSFQTTSQPQTWTRHPLGLSIANSLPTANIKVEQMVGTSPDSHLEPHTLWAQRQTELESSGPPVPGRPHSIAEREQLKHELEVLDQQIQLVSHDEQLTRQLQQLEVSLQGSQPITLDGRQGTNSHVMVPVAPRPTGAPLPPRYGAPRVPLVLPGVVCPRAMAGGMFSHISQP